MVRKILYHILLFLVCSANLFAAKNMPSDLAQTVSHTFDSDTGVFVIKDVHCHYGVQYKINEILQFINKNYGVSFIAVEGSNGKLSFDVFRGYPDVDKARNVLDYFVKSSDLLGAEYFSSLELVSGNDIPVFGLEDIALYKQNKHNFIHALSKIDVILPEIEECKRIVDDQVVASIDQNDKVMYRLICSFDETNPFFELFACVKNNDISLKLYPVLNEYFVLWKKILALKKGGLEEEAFYVVNVLKKSGSKDHERIKSLGNAYVAGVVGPELFFREINIQIEDKKIEPKNGAVARYVGLLDAISRLSFYEIDKEIKRFFPEQVKRICTNKADGNLMRISRRLSFLKNLVKLSMAPSEYSYFLHEFGENNDSEKFAAMLYDELSEFGSFDLPDMSEFCSLLIPFLDFYHNAFERDKVMNRKLAESLREVNRKGVAVIVAGGFHSKGISDFLSGRKISHTLVVPKIPKDVAYDKRVYLSKIGGDCSMFDQVFREYLMELQVWHNFSTDFPDQASRINAMTFLKKLEICLLAVADMDDPLFMSWANALKDKSDYKMTLIAKNRDGLIFQVDTDGVTAPFIFEVRVDNAGRPEVVYNPFYAGGMTALKIDENDREITEISNLVYDRLVKEDAFKLGSPEVTDLARFMLMIKMNNPRVFYAITEQVSQRLSLSPLSGNLTMKFNLALDEAQLVSAFLQNGVLVWSEVDEFLSARKAVFETGERRYGKSDNFSMRVDFAAKSAELTTMLYLSRGIKDKDNLLDMYFGHLMSCMVRKNEPGDGVFAIPYFPRDYFDTGGLWGIECAGKSLFERVRHGASELFVSVDGIRTAKLAEYSIIRFSTVLSGDENVDNHNLPDMNKFFNEAMVNVAPVEALRGFYELLLAEDERIVQPLLRVSGDLTRAFSDEQKKIIMDAVGSKLFWWRDEKTGLVELNYQSIKMHIKLGDTEEAEKRIDPFLKSIEEALLSDFQMRYDVKFVERVSHQLAVLSKMPWLSAEKKSELSKIYSRLNNDYIRFSKFGDDWNDYGPLRYKTLHALSGSKLNGYGKVVRLDPRDFDLSVVSEESRREVDHSEHNFLPMPGYKQIERPGRSVPQMVREESHKDGRPVMAAINGSNGDWVAANSFLILNGELVTKPVPGSYQKKVVPLNGIFNIIGFNKNNVPSMQQIEIKDNKLVGEYDIVYGIPGPEIVKDGRIVPAPTKDDPTTYAKLNELDFRVTETEIRSSFSAMGIDKNGELVLITLTGEMNIPGMSILLEEQGVKDAILLGGSGDSQLVVYNGRPVIAEERKDKHIGEESSEPRRVAQGLIFYSKAKGEVDLLHKNMQNLWERDRTEDKSSLGVVVLAGGENGVLSEDIKSTITDKLEELFYVSLGEEKHNLTEQEVFRLWGEEYLIPQIEKLGTVGYSASVVAEGKNAVMTGDVETFDKWWREQVRYGSSPYITSILVTKNTLQKGIQRILVKEKMPRSEVIKKLGISEGHVYQVLRNRNLDDLDTQEFLQAFILDQRAPHQTHDASITKFMWDELQGGRLAQAYEEFSENTKELFDKRLNRLIVGVHVPSPKDINHFWRNTQLNDAKHFQSVMSDFMDIPQAERIQADVDRAVESSL